MHVNKSKRVSFVQLSFGLLERTSNGLTRVVDLYQCVPICTTKIVGDTVIFWYIEYTVHTTDILLV